MLKSILFWQPKTNLLTFISKTMFGTSFILFFNYFIWFFLAYLSILLVKKDPNIFWQLFLATLFAEVIERFSKASLFWSRPITKYQSCLPKGLVKSWYDTGSFPSGHTSKALFFFLFIIQYQVFPQNHFILIATPLLLFRVLVGFHYPVDIIGGLAVGFLSWVISSRLTFPFLLVQFIKNISDLFFK